MHLGRLIRAHQITIVANEICASACVFALMGGVRRYFSAGTKIGVHQFYSDRVLENLEKKEFTGVEQIAQQVTMGAVLEYASEMGIDSALIALASKTLPIDWPAAGFVDGQLS